MTTEKIVDEIADTTVTTTAVEAPVVVEKVVTDAEREIEREKYEYSYKTHQRLGAMNQKRFTETASVLKSLPVRGTYLDVSCGRGEMLRYARSIGFRPCRGTEIVPELIDGNRIVQAWAHDLPQADKSYDVVSMYDVIEHLIPDDDMKACKHIFRIAKKYALISASNLPSINKRGQDVHINKRPYDEWDRLFKEWFVGCKVTHVGPVRKSEMWVIEIPQ